MPTTQAAMNFHARLGVGINVDWCKNLSDRKAYNDARKKGISFPQIFKDLGFDHARIRVKEYILFARAAQTNMTLTEEIIQCVNDCNAAGLTPIVAFQGQYFKDDPNSGTIAAVVSWWQEIAARLKGLDTAFNVIIETTDKIRYLPGPLNDLYQQYAEMIKDVDPDRVSIVCPVGISDAYQLKTLIVPQGHFFAEAHFMAAGPSRTKGTWTTGTEAERQLIAREVQTMADWTAQTGIPVWDGAFMPGNYNAEGENSLLCDYTVSEQIVIAQYVLGVLKGKSVPVAINSDSKFWDSIACKEIAEMKPLVEALFG